MPVKKIKKRLQSFYEHPGKFSLLLLFILMELISYPVFQHWRVGYILIDIASTLVLIAGVAAVSNTRINFVLALFLGGFALLGIWYLRLMGMGPGANIIFVSAILSRTVFEWFVVILILKKILQVKEITLDTIAGAVSAYLFIGAAFALTYLLVIAFNPAALLMGGQPISLDHVFVNLLYFSFVTLTTLGYGDITPVDPLIRTVAYLEAAFGVLYMATIIASFVGIHISQPPQRDADKQ